LEPRKDPRAAGGSGEHKAVLHRHHSSSTPHADISHTGFVDGTMMIPPLSSPSFSHIADFARALRRNRGRRRPES